jgi:hypothetical protein
MGVLIPGGDVTSLKRTAAFFLNSFADRLKVQDQERKELGDKYESTFKGKRSKEDSKARRKQILVTHPPPSPTASKAYYSRTTCYKCIRPFTNLLSMCIYPCVFCLTQTIIEMGVGYGLLIIIFLPFHLGCGLQISEAWGLVFTVLGFMLNVNYSSVVLFHSFPILMYVTMNASPS